MLYNISFRSIAYLSAVLMKFIVKRRSEDENSVGYHSVIIFKKLCSDMGGGATKQRTSGIGTGRISIARSTQLHIGYINDLSIKSKLDCNWWIYFVILLEIH